MMNGAEKERAVKSIEATYHSLVMAKERLGLKAEAAEKAIRRAYAEGLDAAEFCAKEREYLCSKELGGAEVKFYKGSCYVFSQDGSCITVYKAPSWFGRKQFFDGKKKIRNPKDYYRHYGVTA